MKREEAVKRLKERIDRQALLLDDEDMAALTELVPELAESEDERVRKWLVDYFTGIDENWIHREFTCKQIVAYLEKQKEQKFAEWKPKPESLEALKYAIEGRWEMIKPTSYLSRRLEDLYEELVNNFNVDETLVADKDIEELKALKAEIDASMEQKLAKHACANDESEYDKGYRDGHKFGLQQTENYTIGKTFKGLIPCWINAPSEQQPVSDHHEIEVEFRGEKVTISREFYRNGEMNYSTSEQDDNAIWSALRAWCEKKGITPFELYPKQPEQPVYGLEEEMDRYYDSPEWEGQSVSWMTFTRIARHFAEWQKKLDDLETADLLAIAHLQGMEQQKSRMLADAVEGEISVKFPVVRRSLISVIDMPKDFKYGDKVSVIIIKED